MGEGEGDGGPLVEVYSGINTIKRLLQQNSVQMKLLFFSQLEMNISFLRVKCYFHVPKQIILTTNFVLN